MEAVLHRAGIGWLIARLRQQTQPTIISSRKLREYIFPFEEGLWLKS